MILDALGPLLANYYSRAGSAVEYVRTYNLAMDEILAHAGSIAMASCTFDGWGYFNFDDNGENAVIIEALADDAETIIDLVSWPLNSPKSFAAGLGVAAVLGAANVVNPASWYFGANLRAYKTPLHWLLADCTGICILDYKYAGHVLADALGPIEVGSVQRQAELRRLLCTPAVDPRNIVVAAPLASEAAA